MTTEIEATVHAAEKIICDLEEKQESLLGRNRVLSKQRQECSYAAHTGDKAARNKLNSINSEAATLDGEIESIEAALIEARARLNAAKGAEASAADRAQALALREANAKFLELALAIDDAFADVISAATEMKETLDAIHRLGCPSPSSEQLRVLGAIAVKTALMAIPCGWSKEFEMVPPNQRRSFKSLVSGWHDQIAANVTARLGEQKKDAA